MRGRVEAGSPTGRPRDWRTRSWMPRAVTAAGCDRPLGARRGERVVQGFGSDLDPLWHREHDLALVVQEPFRVDDRYADKLASGIEAKVMTLGRPVETDRFLRVRAMEV